MIKIEILYIKRRKMKIKFECKDCTHKNVCQYSVKVKEWMKHRIIYNEVKKEYTFSEEPSLPNLLVFSLECSEFQDYLPFK